MYIRTHTWAIGAFALTSLALATGGPSPAAALDEKDCNKRYNNCLKICTTNFDNADVHDHPVYEKLKTCTERCEKVQKSCLAKVDSKGPKPDKRITGDPPKHKSVLDGARPGGGRPLNIAPPPPPPSPGTIIKGRR
jgi:hypothetical protein